MQLLWLSIGSNSLQVRRKMILEANGQAIGFALMGHAFKEMRSIYVVNHGFHNLRDPRADSCEYFIDLLKNPHLAQV